MTSPGPRAPRLCSRRASPAALPSLPMLLAAAGLLTGCTELAPFAREYPAECDGYALDDVDASASEAPVGARVFALQPKIVPEGYTSYEGYREQLTRLVDERVRPCLAEDRPNVLVFPEDLGLPAAFIGSRGEKARAAASVEAAFEALEEPYSGPIDHYAQRWPELEPAEHALLGLTDTLWRAFAGTSREIATSTGAYVVSSTRVSGGVYESTDVQDMATLRDPDLGTTSSVFVATERHVYTTTFVFGPDGSVLAAARKAYPTHPEEPSRGLSPGALADVHPVEIGGLQAGIVTGRDAWMPDVLGRLTAQGADVLLQPEATPGWGSEELPGDWLPAVLQQSGWAAVQKHGGLRFSVIPHLTGNLLDRSFDGQSAIVADSIPGDEEIAYVGQPPSGGFLQVAPWLAEDPGVAEPGLALSERRDFLRARALEALPGRSNANGYVETVVAADIAPRAPYPVVEGGPPGALGPSIALAPSSEEQASPVVAAWAGVIVVAWQEPVNGVPQIVSIQSGDGGLTWSPRQVVAPSAAEQSEPTIAVDATGFYVAWVERDGDVRRLTLAQSPDGRVFGERQFPAGPQVGTDLWSPSLAVTDGPVCIAFVATFDGNERVLVAHRELSGTWFVVAADAANLAFPAGDPRNNQWAPSISAFTDQVAVAWVDFRNGNWDVFGSMGFASASFFTRGARIDDGGDEPGRLHSDPHVLMLPGSNTFQVAWTDVRGREARSSAHTTTFQEEVLFTGEPPIAPSDVLGVGPAGASSYRPRLVRAGDGTLLAVWQDHRTGGSDIYLAKGSEFLGFDGEARVDDGGEGPSYQLSPSIATWWSDGVVVVWEDTRSGTRQIRAAIHSGTGF